MIAFGKGGSCVYEFYFKERCAGASFFIYPMRVLALDARGFPSSYLYPTFLSFSPLIEIRKLSGKWRLWGAAAGEEIYITGRVLFFPGVSSWN